MKNQNKKGFTLVELVIVIAVIAILAGVLIGTFATVISRANQSKAVQEWRATVDEAYVNYVADAHDVPTAVTINGNTVVFGDLTKLDSLANVYPLTANITIVLNAVKGQEVYFNWVSNEKASTYDIATVAKNTVAAEAKSSEISTAVAKSVVETYIKSAFVTGTKYYKLTQSEGKLVSIEFSETQETGFETVTGSISLGTYNGTSYTLTLTVDSVTGVASNPVVA